VTNTRFDNYPIKVAIKDSSGNKIFECSQKDLFGKNKHPAKPHIIDAVKKSVEK